MTPQKEARTAPHKHVFKSRYSHDDMVDDDWVGRHKQRVESRRNLWELHPLALKYLLQVLVAVDVLALVSVLQTVSLDVLPEGVNDHRTRLRVDSEQTCQTDLQLELHWLNCNKRTRSKFQLFYYTVNDYARIYNQHVVSFKYCQKQEKHGIPRNKFGGILDFLSIFMSFRLL